MIPEFRFAQPLVFLSLLLLPLLWWLWSRRVRRPVIRFSDIRTLRSASVSGRGWRWMLVTLRSIAIICLAVAAARPQKPNASTRIFAEGIAIQMVVDNSGSMVDLDLSPPGTRMTRLDVVKEVFKKFVDGRPNDLIGMVRFAGHADSVCPLTLDHANLLKVLDQIQIVPRGRADEDGTAIGDGLAMAVERLRDLKRTVGSGEQLTITSRVAILLTDGENNRGMITPEQAGELAALNGIKVYSILAGTGQVIGNPLFGRQPLEDKDLRRIAKVSGGKFFHATDARSLKEIYDEIDKLERTKVEERKFSLWDELALPWLVAAFMTLTLQSLLDATWLRKIP